MLENIKSLYAHAVSAITSIICMGQMGAVLGATTGSMVTMGGSSSSFIIASILSAIGLGFLTQISDSILRLLLIAVLLVTVLVSYSSYKKHNNAVAFGLTIFSAIAIYSSIYILGSELLYFVSFILLLIAAFYNSKCEKR